MTPTKLQYEEVCNLSQGELSIGMFVILSGLKPFCPTTITNNFDSLPDGLINCIDSINSNITSESMCFKTISHIRAINFPYIVLGLANTATYVVDTRKCTFVQVTDDFVKAFDLTFFEKSKNFVLTNQKNTSSLITTL